MLQESLLTLPKFIKLCRRARLKPAHAIGHLCCIWIRSWQSASEMIGDDDDVEIAAGWDGKPGVLLEALSSTRWIDRAGDKWTVHDFWEHAPHHVKQRHKRAVDRETERGAESKTPEPANGDTHSEKNGLPAGTGKGRAEPKTPKKKRSVKETANAVTRTANAVTRTANGDDAPLQEVLPNENENEYQYQKENQKEEEEIPSADAAENSTSNRPQDEFFNAIRDVTQTDQKLKGSRIAMAKQRLEAAGYLAADVLAYGELHRRQFAFSGTYRPPPIQALEECIGQVRHLKTNLRPASPVAGTKHDKHAADLAAILEKSHDAG